MAGSTTASDCQVLVVELTTAEVGIRVITGYGPQETDPINARKYRECIEENVMRAKLQGLEVIILEDANGKLGIDNNRNPQSENGKLLQDMLIRTGLVVENHAKECRGGPYTRVRKFDDGRIEQSAIDYVLASSNLHQKLSCMTIDSDRLYPIVRYNQKFINGGNRVKPAVFSDHFTIIVEYELKSVDQIKYNTRKEIYRLRDVEHLEKF